MWSCYREYSRNAILQFSTGRKCLMCLVSSSTFCEPSCTRSRCSVFSQRWYSDLLWLKKIYPTICICNFLLAGDAIISVHLLTASDHWNLGSRFRQCCHERPFALGNLRTFSGSSPACNLHFLTSCPNWVLWYVNIDSRKSALACGPVESSHKFWRIDGWNR